MESKKTIKELRSAYLKGETTPSDVWADFKKVVAEKDKDIHAFLHIFESGEEAAARATSLIKEKGEGAPPLTGIPIALKQNILAKGEKTTAASKILENYVASYDATIVTRLRNAGALFPGGANMDEFAMGSSTENSAFGPTKNPIDTSRVPGGSSGGSGAAVSMGAVPAAIGTDTGGSVRSPASYCGVVGLKPTYGAVSRNGLIAMGSSLDQAGPLTNTVTDAEILFETMRGIDRLDATTYADGAYPEVVTKDTYRIGVPRDFLNEGIDEDVKKLFEENLEALAKAGHEIVDVELPFMKKGLAAYYIVMPAEVSSNLARYDGVRFGLHVEGKDLLEDYKKTRAEGFGEEVKRRILLGTYVLSAGYYDAYYGKAEQVRTLMREELASAFGDIDVIATPTTPTPAFKLGEKSDPLSMYIQDIFTVPANLTGVPAISLPKGTVSREGIALPVGFQLIAPHAGETRLFDLGKKMLGE